MLTLSIDMHARLKLRRPESCAPPSFACHTPLALNGLPANLNSPTFADMKTHYKRGQAPNRPLPHVIRELSSKAKETEDTDISRVKAK
jgi:hypothetical protein